MTLTRKCKSFYRTLTSFYLLTMTIGLILIVNSKLNELQYLELLLMYSAVLSNITKLQEYNMMQLIAKYVSTKITLAYTS